MCSLCARFGDLQLHGHPHHPCSSSVTGNGADLDFGVLQRALLHDLGRAQLIPPVDDIYLATVLSQKPCLLHRGVAAADDRQGLPPEHGRRAVADRTRADSLVPEAIHLARAGEVQPPRHRPCQAGMATSTTGRSVTAAQDWQWLPTEHWRRAARTAAKSCPPYPDYVVQPLRHRTCRAGTAGSAPGSVCYSSRAKESPAAAPPQPFMLTRLAQPGVLVALH